MSYEVSGSAHALNGCEGIYGPPDSSFNYTLPTSLPMNYKAVSDGSYDDFDDLLKAEIIGDVSVVFTWAPDSPQDLPPTKISVRERLEMSAPVSGIYVVDPSIVSSHNTSVKGFSGKALVQIANSGRNSVVKLLMRHLKVTSSSEKQADSSVAAAEIQYSAQEDLRFVNLSRGVPALKEGDPDLRKERDEWVDADGNGHGHSRFSYNERSLVSGQYTTDPVDILQSISANRSGYPSDISSLTWRWAVDPLSASYQASINAITFYTVQGNSLYDPTGYEAVFNDSSSPFIPGWYRVPSQGSKNISITYDLTDAADGAVATAKYDLTLHDEWENAIPDNRFVAQPSGEVGVSYEEQYLVPQGAASVDRDTNATWSITQTDDFVFELKAFFEATFGLQDWGKAGGSMETKKTFTLQSVNGTAAGKPVDIYPDHTASARYLSVVVSQAKRVHKLFDRFDASGFMPNPATMAPAVGPGIQRNDPRWGKTPQSKIDSVSNPRADWWPYKIGQSFPPEGGTGTWDKSGSYS